MKKILKSLLTAFYERDLPELCNRNIYFPEIKGKVASIIGMRRTGKTFLCYRQMQKLLGQGVPKERLLYLNFEDDRLFGFKIEDCQQILDVYFSMFPDNRSDMCYFFFDEIQEVKGWELFIRRILDTEKIQVTLTGSSSKLLSREIATSLRGRAIEQEVFPLDFTEFLQFHEVFEKIPEAISPNSEAKLSHWAGRYFEIGGFPEVQHFPDEVRQLTLQSYLDSVILKDVVERHNVTNVTALRYLINSLINATGQRFSLNKFYNTLKSLGIKCSKDNLYDFVEYLADAYLLFRLPLLTDSERVRQVNPDKIYMIDLGLIRSASKNPDKNHGAYLENLVYLHLRRLRYDLAYVNTSGGHEVDFHVSKRGSSRQMLIQVCYDLSDETTFEREIRAIEQAGISLKIDDKYIITWDEERDLPGNIQAIPIWKFLLKSFS